MYEIKSGEGTALYYNYYVYCPENKKEQIRQYYQTNKKWSIVMNQYGADEYEIPLEMTAQEEGFLYDIETQDPVRLPESQIIDYADLKMTTSDGVIAGDVSISYDGKKWYVDTDEVEEDSSGEQVVYYVYELPESLNEKISQSISNIGSRN